MFTQFATRQIFTRLALLALLTLSLLAAAPAAQPGPIVPALHFCGGKLATIVSVEGSINGMQIRNQQLYFGFLERSREKIQALYKLASRGQVRPLIDSVFPLDKVADAHRKIEKGGMKGKIVIAID